MKTPQEILTNSPLALGVTHNHIGRKAHLWRSRVQRLFLRVRFYTLSAVWVLSLFNGTSYAVPDNVNLSIIKSIESGGNPLAFNPKDHGGKGSRGLFQISEGLRADYNRLNKASIRPQELFSPEVNTRIATWAFTSYYPQTLKRIKQPVNTQNLIVCHNAGCGALKRKSLPKITQSYLKKYRRLSHEA